MSVPRPVDDLKSLAERFVRFGLTCGADEVEVGIGDDIEFGVDVRQGRIENLIEAGSRGLGLRVIKDKKTAYAGSSDLDLGTVETLIRNAVRRAELSSRDEYSGLPERPAPPVDPARLDLFDLEIPLPRSKNQNRPGDGDRTNRPLGSAHLQFPWGQL